MNPNIFKPCPEREVIPPTKPNRTKSEQIKPELAQVVTDSKTGKSYSKGKLLGKVYQVALWIMYLTEFNYLCPIVVTMWSDGGSLKKLEVAASVLHLSVFIH